MTTEPARRGTAPSLGSLLGDAAALASVAAAVLHVSAAVDHRDLPAQAAMFGLSAAVQLAWAMAAAWRFSPSVLVTGALVNLGFVGVWVISRTSGLAFMPGEGHEAAEPIGFKDTTTVVLEVGIVAAIALFALLPEAARRLAPTSSRLASGLSFGVVGLLALFGLTQAETGPGIGHGASMALSPAHDGGLTPGHDAPGGVAAAHETAGGAGAPHRAGGLAAEGPGHGHAPSGESALGATGGSVLLPAVPHGSGHGHPLRPSVASTPGDGHADHPDPGAPGHSHAAGSPPTGADDSGGHAAHGTQPTTDGSAGVAPATGHDGHGNGPDGGAEHPEGHADAGGGEDHGGGHEGTEPGGGHGDGGHDHGGDHPPTLEEEPVEYLMALLAGIGKMMSSLLG